MAKGRFSGGNSDNGRASGATGGGGGGTPQEKSFRDKVNEAQTSEDLVSVMRDRYGSGFDSAFVTANNLNNVKRVLNTVDELEERYPFMKGYIKEFGVTNSGIASMGAYIFDDTGGILRINPSYFNIENNPRINGTPGFNHQNANLESAIAHEFGHAVHNWLWERMRETMPNNTFLDQIKMIKLRKSGTWLNEVTKRAKKIAKARTNDALYSGVSGYAKTSKMEGFAEAFADVFRNGDNATTSSKALYQAMSEVLQQYGVRL